MAIKAVKIHLDPNSEEVTEIVLRSATIGDGIQKKILIEKGIARTEEDIPERTMQAEFFPVCVSCVEYPQSVRDMPFEQFNELLDTDINIWYAASLDLNKHWDLSIPPEEKKKWDIEDWLRAAYDNPEAEAGLMPDFEEKVFIFGRMSDELVLEAQKILTVLELTGFKWTILDVLRQPEELLNAVFYMKNIGEKMHIQSAKKKNAKTAGA